ncbi:hypothetical protein [Absidia glauca]|uniref:NDT80 domain-containing protein n=1 Tax=Absidia glauca TaxID=4829 RepID=A0A163JP17_ABSGL|nr:hypothetical protein [Absidia glauca]
MNKAQHNLATNHQRAHSMPTGALYNGQVSQQNEVVFSSKRRHPVGIDEALLFGPTRTHSSIYQQDQSTLCQLELRCRVDRGFFISNQHWTCYRRNYFQLSGAFITHCNENQVFYIQNPSSGDSNGSVHSGEESRNDSLLIPIQGFYIQLVAHTSDNDQPVELIQLTAKRDKGPQQIPSMLPIQPCGSSGSGGLLLHYPHDQQHQRTVTYERLQFKSATANNGKKRATQQYFYLTAQLIAQDINQYQHVIATSQSSPLVVRGRSPGHYAEMDQRSQHRVPPATIATTTIKPSPSKRRKAVKERETALQDTPPTDINAPLSPSSLSPIPMSLASEATTTTAAPTPSTTRPCKLPPPSSPSSSSSSSSPPSKATSSRSASSSSVMTQSAIITPTIPSDATSLYYMPSSFNHSRSFSANDSAWHRPYPYPPPPPQQAPQAPYRPHHQQQQTWGAWSPDSAAAYNPPRHDYSKPGDEKPGAPTTFMMYPTTPWDARQHDPLTDYPPKQ